MGRRNDWILLVALTSSLSACQKPAVTAQTPVEPERPPTLQELLPLTDETVSSFELSSDLGDEGLLVLEIYRPRENLAELVIAGRVQRLFIEEHRISHTAGGVLLEEPLEKGHAYQGSFGTATIVDTDLSIELPAGRFSHCLKTVEESTRPPRRSTSVYCPSVGLVQMTVETFGDEALVLETKLLSHGPRVDVRDESTLGNIPEKLPRHE